MLYAHAALLPSTEALSALLCALTSLLAPDLRHLPSHPPRPRPLPARPLRSRLPAA